MSNIEILEKNYLDTTTLISVSSGTDSAKYLFNRKSVNQYQSSGFNTNTSAVTIGVEFLSAKNIDRIAIQNTNLKNFKVYYNSNAANLFSITSAETGTASWTGNSDTALYLKFATVAATSVFIVATGTMSGGDEKKIGGLWIGANKFTFENNPTAKGLKARLDRRKSSHEMSDGGNATYVFGDSYRADIRLSYQSDTMRDNLKDIYDDKLSFVIATFPTGTSWEGDEIYEVNWDGDFDFKQPATEDWDSGGWSGRIRLRETPK
ncbi:MAG: hypothetical protein GY853_15285 [PVC group bacterium]|nr:hypothetical protein [PVC group bacterium]